MTGIDSGRIERFSRGEPVEVEVAAIERELSALWREAAQARPISRAALWNLIVYVGRSASLVEAKDLVGAMASFVPARVIVLSYDGHEASGPELGATVESNVVSTPGGARTISSEEITLTARGAGVEHFAPLARALTAPGLPTALLWIDDPPARGRLMRQLLMLSGRLVVDTGVVSGDGDLASLHQLAGLAQARVADLGWLRLESFRLLFAGLFDPPVGGAPLRAPGRITIHHQARRAASALLFVGWLACQLGWTRPEARDSRSGDGRHEARRFRFSMPGGARMEVDLVAAPTTDGGTLPEAAGTAGVVAVELDTGGAGFAVRRTAGNRAELCLPVAPPRSVKLDSRSRMELCVEALRPRGHDPLFAGALAFAADLVAASEWTR